MMSTMKPVLPLVLSLALFCFVTGFPLFLLRIQTEQLLTETSNTADEIRRLQSRISEWERGELETQFPGDMLWHYNNVSDAELALQDAVVEIAQRQGLNLVRFGSVPLMIEAHTDYIAIEIEGAGSLEAAYRVLESAEKALPPISVHSVRMQPGTGFGLDDLHRDEVSVFVQMTIWAFVKETE